ncbi:MAG TPA: ATP-binding protein [Actinomycetota bacterium]
MTLILPATLQAPARARRAVEEALGGRVDDVLVYETELLVTELVTNCIRHGELRAGDRVELSITLGEDRLRVEVRDPGRGFDPGDLVSPVEVASSGWGLRIVNRLSNRWGSARGKPNVTWFEVDLDGRQRMIA